MTKMGENEMSFLMIHKLVQIKNKHATDFIDSRLGYDDESCFCSETLVKAYWL